MSRVLEDAAVLALRAIPRSAATRAIGWLAERPVPPPARRVVLGGLGRALGINLTEAEKPVEAYPSFQALFCRRLRPEVRPLASPDPRAIYSPVDGRLRDLGRVLETETFEVKGQRFDLGVLLGSKEEAAPFVGGRALLFYLGPRDYHRMHSPVTGWVQGFRWIRGEFWPVNRLAARIPGIYTDNERVVTYLGTPFGRVAMVKVAAFGVGYISLAYRGEPAGVRVHGQGRPEVHFYRNGSGPRVTAGEEIAAFGLGSTVVLCFEPKRVDLGGATDACEGHRGKGRRGGQAWRGEGDRVVRVGEPIGRFVQ